MLCDESGSYQANPEKDSIRAAKWKDTSHRSPKGIWMKMLHYKQWQREYG